MRTLRGRPLEESSAAPSKSRGSSASISSGTSTIRAAGRATIRTVNTLQSYDVTGARAKSDAAGGRVLPVRTPMSMPAAAPESKAPRTATLDRAPLAGEEELHQPFVPAEVD